MPSTRFLVFMAALGLAFAIVFSFTVLGVAGELLTVYALVWLLAKAVIALRRRYFVP
ncbi:MAG TPA: hypothetical protein VKR79_12165 [Gaiellaceae bacterium]|nr:hypothetical protein [Gaiellaceae bacterium]